MNDNQLAISLSCHRYLSTGSPLHTWNSSSIHSCSHSLLSLEVGELVAVRGCHVGDGRVVGGDEVGQHHVGGRGLLRRDLRVR